jgi:hypothetical protein
VETRQGLHLRQAGSRLLTFTLRHSIRSVRIDTMARSKSKNRSSTRRRNAMPPPSLTRRRVVTPNPILMLEDRRQWQPIDTSRRHRAPVPAAALTRKDRRIVSPLSRPAWNVSFAVPENISICHRRKRRREVLFARLKTGKNSSVKRKRKNWWSKVSC